MHRLVCAAAFVIPALAVAFAATPALAKEAKRYGIKGVFREYDEARSVFKVDVTANEAPSFGGSTAGGKAPGDVKSGEPLELLVKPEGSVLSRTVIKSTQGTGLDNSGTADGFKKAVALIPTDRAIIFSIEKNEGAAAGAPPYRLQTAFIPITDAEAERRLRAFTEGKDGDDIR